MAVRKISILIVDKRTEVRESLWELLRDAKVDLTVADSAEVALLAFNGERTERWPGIVVLGHGPMGCANSFLLLAKQHQPEIFRKSSVVVFPILGAAVSEDAGAEDMPQVCRLDTLANLLAMVRGLVDKRMLSLEAS